MSWNKTRFHISAVGKATKSLCCDVTVTYSGRPRLERLVRGMQVIINVNVNINAISRSEWYTWVLHADSFTCRVSDWQVSACWLHHHQQLEWVYIGGRFPGAIVVFQQSTSVCSINRTHNKTRPKHAQESAFVNIFYVFTEAKIQLSRINLYNSLPR